MLAQMRKYLSPAAKEKILDSWPYRLLNRIKLYRYKQIVRFSCELTTRCNAKCIMCTRSSFINNGELSIVDMDQELIERIIQKAEEFNQRKKHIYFVTMGLGEPLLFKSLFDLFGRLKHISSKIYIVLVTNGIALDGQYSEKLIALGVDEVSISLNDNNASDYAQHMGVDAYERVYHNIETLINMRNQSGKKLPSVFVQYLDFKNNPGLFLEDIKRWRKLMRYADKCYIHPIVNEGGFFKGKEVRIASKKNFPCTQPLSELAIKINGDIYPCDACFYSGLGKIPSLYLGNAKTDDYFNLFSRRDGKPKKILKQMRKGDYSNLPQCEICTTYKLSCNCFFELPRWLRFKNYRWL